MGKYDTVCSIKKGDVFLDCKGYTAEEVIEIIKATAELDSENALTEEMKEEIKERLVQEGEMSEYVSTTGKDKEIVDVERTLKTAKLPTCTSNFKCPGCDQQILLVNNDTLLVRDYRDKKIYDIGQVELPEMYKDGEPDNTKIVAIYKDCLGLITKTKDYVLISDSTDTCHCPVCNHDGIISEFVEYYEDDDACDICGNEKENILTQAGESYDCANHCIKKLKED